MGTSSSKSSSVIEEEAKIDNKLSNLDSTPSRVLPFDPRSPSGNVNRTPISVLATPNGPKDVHKGKPVKSLLLDPRSPSQAAPRTPIQIEETENCQKYQPLKASKLAQAMPLLPDECKTAQVAKDPRSPTDKVPRTPLQENIDLDSLSLQENGKENNEESGIILGDSSLGNEANERVEFNNSDVSQEKERRPLSCVHNKNSDEPRAKLQAKQCRSLEEEFTKNEKNILNKLEVSLEEKVDTDVVKSSTDFVQDI